MLRYSSSISSAIEDSIHDLQLVGADVDVGRWQGVPTEGKPDLVTKEIIDLGIVAPMPQTIVDAQDQIAPNLTWAEDHFQERVSRNPSNPGVEYQNWPWWRGQDQYAMRQVNQTSREDFDLIFDHTYQERFWPKKAGLVPGMDANVGIRYRYGDLDDVVNLLRREPYTRQATFPIFFPEDTGAVHGGRIPCTLHYHFLLRRGKLHLWYAIRSCDAVRHFRDDLYLACRLAQWVLGELLTTDMGDEGTQFYPEPWGSTELGNLHFTAYSFHYHRGDEHLL